jgi:Icc-related predicted phosphoesterase
MKRQKIFWFSPADKKIVSLGAKMIRKNLMFVRTVILFFILSSALFAGERDLTFVMWSDIHYGAFDATSAIRLDVIKTINNLDKKDFPAEAKIKGKVGEPAFLISLGDTTENGKAGQWNNPDKPAYWSYLQTIKQLKPSIKTYEVLGNHDSRKQENIRQIFRERHGNTYYSFDVQGVHFVVLDPYHWSNTPKPELDDEQLAWLKKNLDALPKNTPIVLAMHIVPDTATGDRTCHLDEASSKKLADIVKDKNVIVWLHGHFHSTHHGQWLGTDVISTGFCYDRKTCKDGSPMFMVVRISDRRIVAINYDWEKNQWANVVLDKSFETPAATTRSVHLDCIP